MIDKLLENAPLWVLIAAIIWLKLPDWAERFAIVGRLLEPLSKRWQEKAARNERNRREVMEAEARRLAPDYAEMERRLKRMDIRLRLVEKSNEVNEAFIRYDADWHFNDEMAAVGRPECVPAPRISHSQFERQYREGWRPD
ncbi:hypothetical protein [Mycolicibacterium komossense]|uniref:Uncharacterized protein n=1 Tax=Mycolicibacterium komossense TaxID=1779 RepID=A0ABT3C9D8_9MYCO|nr:hypothetical protein [Mycolicibacterium komossense]MCV7226041.1 hypothetical protein [Mycolicibacterium komossense]